MRIFTLRGAEIFNYEPLKTI